MSASQQLSHFDFTKPNGLIGELADQWKTWIGGFCNTFAEKWKNITGIDINLRLDASDAYTFNNSKSRIPKPAYANHLFVGTPSLRTLLVMNQSLSLALVFQLLEEQLAELPAEREMTAVERSLFELVVKYLADALSESWPQKDPLTCSQGEMEAEPHRSRMLAPGELVLFCRLNIDICNSQQNLDWIIPHQGLKALLSATDEIETTTPGQSSEQMAQRVQEIPVELCMKLGEATLPVSSMAALEPGDVVVLNQPIDEPLPICIGDRIKFLGWLGRNHKKRACKISELV